MPSVFAPFLAALSAVFGGGSSPPPAPPSVVSGPFDAYLAPGSAAAVLPYRKRDWPGPGDGIEQDAGSAAPMIAVDHDEADVTDSEPAAAVPVVQERRPMPLV